MSKRGYYIVRKYDFPATVLDGLPTPMLISLGGGLAWQQIPGIWRAAEPKTDPPNTQYTNVIVTRNYEDYPA